MNKELSEKNQALKASFWYTVSNFFVKGLSFITIPIFARILSKADMGYANNFSSWLSMLTIIITLSLHASLVRARFDYEDDIYSFVSSNLLLGSIVTLGFGIIFLCNENLVTQIISMDIKYVLIMFADMLVVPAYTMFCQVQRFQYKYKVVVGITMGVSVGSVLLSLFLIHNMSDQLFAKVLGMQLPTIIISIISYCYFWVRGHTIRWEYMKYSLVICGPYIVHLLAGTLLNSSDRAMITSMCSAEQTALYGMGASIAMIVSVLWNSLNAAFSPWLGEKLNSEEYNSIKQYTYGYILIFVYIVMGVAMFAPELLYILGGQQYIEAKYVIPPLMYGYVLLFVYSMYVNIEQYEKRTKGMAVATLAAAIINVLLNAWLLPKNGYVVAAYTTVVGYLFLFVFHFLLVKKMGYEHVYDTKFVFFVVFCSALLMLTIRGLYEIDIIRYVVILIYVVFFCVILYKNKNVFLRIIK